VTTVRRLEPRRKEKKMNEEEPINEFTTQPLMTREFLENIARRGKEHISILDKALAELYLELGITDEDQ
jgi:hypothetical protein